MSYGTQELQQIRLLALVGISADVCPTAFVLFRVVGPEVLASLSPGQEPTRDSTSNPRVGRLVFEPRVVGLFRRERQNEVRVAVAWRRGEIRKLSAGRQLATTPPFGRTYVVLR